MAVARRAAKPLHPRGDVVRGVLRRSGTPATPPAWCDEAGEDDVLVRRSRSLGLPPYLPDIQGLAVRVPVPEGHADLLFAGTGFGHLTRFLLTPSRTPGGRPMTTLLPYRSPHGPLLLGAKHLSATRLVLLCASPAGRWQRFGDLTLGDVADAEDAEITFDPLLHTAPGLENYPWVERLREPAYVTARRTSGRPAPR
ncbi:hypothetical protein H9L09_14165 [Nocardioides mesophilus]|uniref:Phosphodiesterase n=1 Tax=Nocardioides mesophilus TaxID=433659 RepID=A0A7G9RHI1_9ACTN|nr:hypothetical protein H9L09_14165 [Nocardioides mesophilus]